MTAVLDPGGAPGAGPRTPVQHPALAVAGAAAAVVVAGVTAAVASPAMAVAAGADRVPGAVLYAQEEPPGEILYQNEAYYLYEDAAGHYLEGGRGERQPMLSFEYSNATDDRFLTVEQWGERELDASVSVRVRPFEFTNILPGPAADA